jgi:SAM-dependent methyltransferase
VRVEPTNPPSNPWIIHKSERTRVYININTGAIKDLSGSIELARDWFQYFKDQGIENFPLFVYHYYFFRTPTVGYIRKHVPEGGSIIELGCGSALLSILLSSMGYKVLGIDNDPRVVEMARLNNERLGGRAEIELMDLFDAPRLLGKDFDLAYSEGVVEHFKGAKLREAVKVHRELARKAMIVVPSRDDPLVTDQDKYDFGKLERLCRSVGLKPVDRFAIGTGLIKWPKLLMPPILLKRMLGRLLKCENIGVVCINPQYI